MGLWDQTRVSGVTAMSPAIIDALSLRWMKSLWIQRREKGRESGEEESDLWGHLWLVHCCFLAPFLSVGDLEHKFYLTRLW